MCSLCYSDIRECTATFSLSRRLFFQGKAISVCTNSKAIEQFMDIGMQEISNHSATVGHHTTQASYVIWKEVTSSTEPQVNPRPPMEPN